jgi:photosystem II stability/assembly factor-like uncharacterized protein
MRLTLPLVLALSLTQAAASLRFTSQPSGVTARFRGISAVDDRVVWASGSNGTIVRTADGGTTWQTLSIPGTDKLDFRDVDAVNDRTAYVLSIGNGEQSRIFKTSDAGANWQEQFVNHDPKAFFDAMAFWDEAHGLAFSDSADNQFHILATSDGGATWTRIPPDRLPAALDNEGAFAASGTNLAMGVKDHVWIGTGAAAQARVLRSADGGKTWAVSATPIAAGPSSGIFSIAFRDATHGIVVGGDYRKEKEAVDNAAITTDGGVTWTAVKGLSGFRSVVAYVPGRQRTVIAVGPSGADYSTDDGEHWAPIEGPGFHTFSCSRSGKFGWGAGEKGAIGRLDLGAF